MMLKRFLSSRGWAAMLLAGGAVVIAGERDLTGIAGQVEDSVSSIPVTPPAATPLTVRRTMPWLLPDFSSLQDNAVVRVVDGEVLGALTTFSNTNDNQVAYFGTVDMLDANGGMSSNNVVVDEFPNAISNIAGQMLGDGRLIYRALFNSGAGQNNLEWVDGDVFSQQPPAFTEPASGTPILTGNGIDGAAGSAFLGTPAAIENDSGGFFVAMTGFDSFTGDIVNGVSIWDYNGAPLPANTPSYSYTQNDAFAWATAAGAVIDETGDTRQSQPSLALVDNVRYVIFGVGDSDFPAGGATGGTGGRRPLILCVDAYEDGNGFTDAVALLPRAGEMFVAFQATGSAAGGADTLHNKHFDMNSSGQLVVVAETTDVDPTVRTQSVLLYEPVFTAGRITGFTGPTVIADTGGVVADNLLGTGFTAPAISGVGIDNAGNIAFTARYDAGGGTPASAVYLYAASQGALHQLVLEEELVGTAPDPQVRVGRFATGNTGVSDGAADCFNALGLADEPDADGRVVLAVPFRDSAGTDPNTDDIRGVIVLQVEVPSGCVCVWDIDGDCDTDFNDLVALLAGYGTTYDFQDLVGLLGEYGCQG